SVSLTGERGPFQDLVDVESLGVAASDQTDQLPNGGLFRQTGTLKHRPDPLALAAGISPEDSHGSRRWPEQTQQQLEDGRLTGSVGAENSDNLTAFDRQVDSVKSVELPICLAHITHLNHGHLQSPLVISGQGTARCLICLVPGVTKNEHDFWHMWRGLMPRYDLAVTGRQRDSEARRDEQLGATIGAAAVAAVGVAMFVFQ